jgi:K+/H+ antiporter YhaU regulatory subunit KhtT
MADVVVESYRLPGIGWRYDVPVDAERRLLLVVEDRGPRHLMLVDPHVEEHLTSARLSEPQAIAFASLLTGARFTVQAADTATELPSEQVESADVVVETIDVGVASSAKGLATDQLVQLLGADVALLGVICDETPELVETDPARMLEAGDRLVVAARRGGLPRVREMVDY